jgi:hypothetical protein
LSFIFPLLPLPNNLFTLLQPQTINKNIIKKQHNTHLLLRQLAFLSAISHFSEILPHAHTFLPTSHVPHSVYQATSPTKFPTMSSNHFAVLADHDIDLTGKETTAPLPNAT